ncbi:MAG: AI-2E family transporter [Steroidobacteraceae bacterium]
MAGIVLVVLVFVLLEQEALRDRFIRIAGGTDIRLTTLVINDAGGRLSRFFVSQFAVNFGVGVLIWVSLSVIGLPHPMVWAALTTLLRFVPYVGVWIAAPLVEPLLYGHTTGLSPLSVVIAAIFWSWLWGPIGLIVSTPLTLCLLVAGRHIKALSLLDILHLARLDLMSGTISKEQQMRVRGALVAVIAAIGGDQRRLSRRHLREEFPHACIVAVFLPGMLLQEDEVGAAPTMRGADKSAGSLGHAVQICLDMQPKAAAV